MFTFCSVNNILVDYFTYNFFFFYLDIFYETQRIELGQIKIILTVYCKLPKNNMSCL